ncbi:sodium- and chloride-dependent GABA transporter 2-like [Acanthaster planci]|uniref:Transporter n=1 Tax=Acanthaster planci TaxID=133434 RepID=A0A8B7YE01_ACAPL|nr:sodium- and chloride-dependent GABA transporter 2-like [Acanthaster planci]
MAGASETDNFHGNSVENGHASRTNKDLSDLDGDPVVAADLPVKSSVEEREQWSSKLDFLLALIGFSVGLGNVWRFPYLCFKNGGGAFLIPYLICLVIGGVPLLLMELGLGQFMAQGGIGVWKISPLFKGIGLGSVVILILLDIYYNIILAWGIYYMFMSFTSVLPWSHCGNDFNTYTCRDPNLIGVPGSTFWVCDHFWLNETLPPLPSDSVNVSEALQNCTDLEGINRTSSVTEFWERKILQIHLSEGLHDIGLPNWQLTLCLLLAWALVYLCVFKGVKSSGKVVYFTATFPYILITILLVRAVTLENAKEGLLYYVKPDLNRLADGQTWLDAATQIFFSYSLGLGNMAALGSYNSFNHNFFRDGVIFAIVNSFTSIYSGIVIFSVLGFMAGQQGVQVSEVAKSGPGLAFIAYPEAVVQMPVAPLWAVLFFFMLLLLGIDSEFVGVEGLATAIVDSFPSLRKGKRRPLFVLAMCSVLFLAGIPMTCYGGMYLFQLFDNYAASGFALLWVAFFESVVIGWVYGADKFYDDFQKMLNWRPNPYLKICWMFLTPAFTMGIFIFSCVSYSPLIYNDYEYPPWGQALGWLMATASMVQVPIFFIYKMLTTTGSLRERWTYLTTAKLQAHQMESYKEDTPMANELMMVPSAPPVVSSEEPPSYDATMNVEMAEKGGLLLDHSS